MRLNFLKIIILAIIIFGLGVFGFNVVSKIRIKSQKPLQPIKISSDKKSILDERGRVILDVADDRIFNFFQKTERCTDDYNRKLVPNNGCIDRAAFRNFSDFVSISLSPRGTEIGFTVSFYLKPDSVAGVLHPFRAPGEIRILTDYYLGNKFLGFSPNGNYFVFSDGCWEGDCSFTITSSETMESLDLDLQGIECERGYGCYGTKFRGWINNEEIEYDVTWGGDIKGSYRYDIITKQANKI
ncbi:MAG: hypothetical protein L6Q29_02235 [Candidatus Pacebacteria bacterium]|nr:hypothetical protein [Candidatus Paceibacterota bacterium]